MKFLSISALLFCSSVGATTVESYLLNRDGIKKLEQKAKDLGVKFDGIWLEAPVEILRRRIGARKNDASDADRAVLEKQLDYDLGAMDWHRVDASPPPDAVAEAALKAIS